MELRKAYTTIDEKIQELTNKIDTYPIQERYNNMMTTFNNKVDVSIKFMFYTILHHNLFITLLLGSIA